MQNIKIGVLTVSDRASAGTYEDISGKSIMDYMTKRIKNEICFEYFIVPDSLSEIKNTLIKLTDKLDCSLVLTTGGTGPSPRDITPEATELVVGRVLPGFGEHMRAVSMGFVPTAILSRQIAGIRGISLIINLPGSPKAIGQCLDAVFPAVPDCIKLLGGPVIEDNVGNSQLFH
jgi:molybdopterin adenylyltransferase